MPEPLSILSAVASTVGTIIKLVELTSHFIDVPDEVKHFHENLQLTIETLNTTRRLRRTKSGFLDDSTKKEVDKSIERTENVLNSVSDSIEACRADLAIKKTVSVKNRLTWMLKDQQSFMSKGMTLTNCLHTLDRDITRMSAVQNCQNPPDYSTISPKNDFLSRRSQRKRAARQPTVDKLVDEKMLAEPCISIQAIPILSEDANCNRASIAMSYLAIRPERSFHDFGQSEEFMYEAASDLHSPSSDMAGQLSRRWSLEDLSNTSTVTEPETGEALKHLEGHAGHPMPEQLPRRRRWAYIS